MKIRQDLSGQKFGCVVVESFSHVHGEGKSAITVWNCRCERCGTVRPIKRAVLAEKRKKDASGTPTYCSIVCQHEQQAVSRIGSKLGRLTVLGRDEAKTKELGLAQWLMKFVCDCGQEFSEFYHVIEAGLKDGSRSGSCSHLCHLKNELREHIGKTFGRLTVLGVTEVMESGHARSGFICSCDCGSVVEKVACKVLSGAISSCGCLLVDAGKSKVGDKNPNWRGGIEQDMNERVGPEAGRWKGAIARKFSWVCQKCGCGGYQDKVCHHLMNFKRFVELRLDLDNATLLCADCHRQFHRQYGILDNTPEQLSEFVGKEVLVSDSMKKAAGIRELGLLDERGQTTTLGLSYLEGFAPELQQRIIEVERAHLQKFAA